SRSTISSVPIANPSRKKSPSRSPSDRDVRGRTRSPTTRRTRALLRSIFSRLSTRRHLDQARFEACQRFNEIALGGHHFVDIFVRHRHFVEAGGQQRDAAFAQKLLRDVPRKELPGFRATHSTTRAVRGGVQGSGIAFSANDVAWRPHRSR